MASGCAATAGTTKRAGTDEMPRMTGPEHYNQAGEFLDLAAEAESDSPAERYCLAAAQVHATLAAAAATALATVLAKRTDLTVEPIREGWYESAGYRHDALNG